MPRRRAPGPVLVAAVAVSAPRCCRFRPPRRAGRGRDTAFVPGAGDVRGASDGVDDPLVRPRDRPSGSGGRGPATPAAQGNAEAESVDTRPAGDRVQGAGRLRDVAPGALPPRADARRAWRLSSGDGPRGARTASAGDGHPDRARHPVRVGAPNSAADAGRRRGRGSTSPGVVTRRSAGRRTRRPAHPGQAARGHGRQRPGPPRPRPAARSVLEGMQWTAAHRTGAENASDAGFTVGVDADRRAVLPDLRRRRAEGRAGGREHGARADRAVAARPRGDEDRQRGVAVSPLRLTVSTTPEMRAAIGPALEAVQPLRTQLLELVEAAAGRRRTAGSPRRSASATWSPTSRCSSSATTAGSTSTSAVRRAGTDADDLRQPVRVRARRCSIRPGLVPRGRRRRICGAAPGTGPLAAGRRPAGGGRDGPGADPGESRTGVDRPASPRMPTAAGAREHRGKLAAGLILALVVLLAAADRLRARLS